MIFEVDRTKCVFKKVLQEDNGYVEVSQAERLSVVWELTKKAWAFAGINTEQRLQRNVANLNRK